MAPSLGSAFFLAGLLALAMGGCAAPVQMQPASLASASAGEPRLSIGAGVEARSSAGFGQTLPAGTVIAHIGNIAEGEVWRPLNFVVTVEGRHIHEAYLVIKAGQWVGFYLPVERMFSPLRSATVLKLEQVS